MIYLAVFAADEGYTMMAMATLQIIKPKVTLGRMSTHYKRTFVCKDYPGTAMSKNHLSDLLQRLGQDGEKGESFYQLRLSHTAEDHHIAIDGTLKQNNSSINDLSAFSYKARIKGRQEVSVLYAYNIKLMEPICAEVFHGKQY